MLFRLLMDPGALEAAGGSMADLAATESTPSVDTSVREPLSQPSANSREPRNFDADVTPANAGSTLAPSSAAPATPSDPNQAAGYTSVRDAARTYGYQFDQEYADDETAFQAIIKQAQANRQADYYAQLGRTLAPHHEKIKSYLNQPVAAPQDTARKAWEAPEFDQRWLAGVELNPQTGLYLAKPGFPQEIAAKVNEYAQWKDEYDKNPAAVINQQVEALASDLFERKFAERAAQQEIKSSVQSITAGNAAWFNAQDAQGRVLYGQNGYPVPSQLGAAYLGHVQTALKMGIRNPRDQDRLAKQLLQGDLAQSQLAKQLQATQGNNPATRQATSNPNVNPLGTLTPSQRAITPAATPLPTDGLSLSEQLARQFAAEGITDDDILSSMR